MATITDALTRHHDVIRDLFEKTAGDSIHFDTLRNHLTIHHQNEETYLYDLMAAKDKSRHDALEAIEEHHVIEMLLQELSNFPKDHERWSVKLEVFEEYTRHHLDEEEEDIFPVVSNIFDEHTRKDLGAKFDAVKDKQLSVL
jgi:hypothetical protein